MPWSSAPTALRSRADNELWRSDGTAAGTTRLLDINPGRRSSSPSGFTEFNGFLYFNAADGTNGRELWRTDGTTAGTTLVLDIRPLATGSNPAGFTRLGAFLYFAANDGTNGTELWRTDGTKTTMVANIAAAGASSSPSGFTEFNGFLYFEADDGTAGDELWRTDGTTTTMVANINPLGANSDPVGFEALGGHLYFEADDGVNGDELWRTDGTGPGTTPVAEHRPRGWQLRSQRSHPPRQQPDLLGRRQAAVGETKSSGAPTAPRTGTVKLKEINSRTRRGLVSGRLHGPRQHGLLRGGRRRSRARAMAHRRDRGWNADGRRHQPGGQRLKSV